MEDCDRISLSILEHEIARIEQQLENAQHANNSALEEKARKLLESLRRQQSEYLKGSKSAPRRKSTVPARQPARKPARKTASTKRTAKASAAPKRATTKTTAVRSGSRSGAKSATKKRSGRR